MAQNNLAYRQKPEEWGYDAEPIALPRPELRTIEGTKGSAQAQPRPVAWVTQLAVMSAVVIVVLASVSVARVSISNATVQMMQTAEQTRLAIDQTRAAGLDLEVQHSLANNPTRIQDSAASLGILPAGQPVVMEAREGFSAETILQMQVAADEARAAEVALLNVPKSDT